MRPIKNEDLPVRAPMTAALVLATAALFGASPARATDPAPTPAAAAYDSEGRRDPFRRPAPGATRRECSGAPGSLARVLVQEVRLTAILSGPAGAAAQFEIGPERRAHFVRAGDAFCDGTVG